MNPVRQSDTRRSANLRPCGVPWRATRLAANRENSVLPFFRNCQLWWLDGSKARCRASPFPSCDRMLEAEYDAICTAPMSLLHERGTVGGDRS